MYRQQQAAIAALEAHLGAYGYTAVCPQPAPAQPPAAAQRPGELPLAAKRDAVSSSGAGDRTYDAGSAAAAPAPAAAPASQPLPPDSTAQAAPGEAATSASSGAVAHAATACSRDGTPLSAVTNLPPGSLAALTAGKPPLPSPSGGSTSSGEPHSVSPSLRCLSVSLSVNAALSTFKRVELATARKHFDSQ